MRIRNFLGLIVLASILVFTACESEEDALTSLLGTWTTSDGGTITFRSDSTGTTMDSEFFNFDCGTITTNGVSETLGPIPDFTWEITDGGAKNNLNMEFSDQTSFSTPCAGSIEFPLTFGSKQVTVGEEAFGFGEEVTLTK